MFIHRLARHYKGILHKHVKDLVSERRAAIKVLRKLESVCVRKTHRLGEEKLIISCMLDEKENVERSRRKLSP